MRANRKLGFGLLTSSSPVLLPHLLFVPFLLAKTTMKKFRATWCGPAEDEEERTHARGCATPTTIKTAGSETPERPENASNKTSKKPQQLLLLRYFLPLAASIGIYLLWFPLLP